MTGAHYDFARANEQEVQELLERLNNLHAEVKALKATKTSG